MYSRNQMSIRSISAKTRSFLKHLGNNPSMLRIVISLLQLLVSDVIPCEFSTRISISPLQRAWCVMGIRNIDIGYCRKQRRCLIDRESNDQFATFTFRQRRRNFPRKGWLVSSSRYDGNLRHCEEGKFRKVSRLNIRHASKSLTDIYVFFCHEEAIAPMQGICFQPLWQSQIYRLHTFTRKITVAYYPIIFFFFCVDAFTCVCINLFRETQFYKIIIKENTY